MIFQSLNEFIIALQHRCRGTEVLIISKLHQGPCLTDLT